MFSTLRIRKEDFGCHRIDRTAHSHSVLEKKCPERWTTKIRVAVWWLVYLIEIKPHLAVTNLYCYRSFLRGPRPYTFLRQQYHTIVIKSEPNLHDEPGAVLPLCQARPPCVQAARHQDHRCLDNVGSGSLALRGKYVIGMPAKIEKLSSATVTELGYSTPD